MKTFKVGATIAIAALATIGPLSAAQAQAQEVPPEPPACTAEQAGVALEQYLPGEGSDVVHRQQMIVTNMDDSATCSVYGIPGVTPLSGSGNEPLGAGSFRGVGDSVPVDLAPGQQARADVSVIHAELFDPNQCEPRPQWGYRIADEQGHFSKDIPVKLQLNICANPAISQIVVSPWKAA